MCSPFHIYFDLASSMAPLSNKELHLFYRVDREVFRFLIFKLHRDVTQSLLVIDLWLWLENIGYPNLIFRLVSQLDTLANALADEAVECLKILEANNPLIPNDGGMPLTKILVQKNISLRIFNEKRYTAIAGIKSVLNNICARIFYDILLIILRSTIIRKANTSSTITSNSPLVVPGFPNPIFGTFIIPPRTMNLDLYDKRIWEVKRPFNDVTDDDKTMLMTFCKGTSISRNEVRDLITKAYRDRMQSIILGTIDKNDQPLYAKVVFNSVAMLDQILNGKRIAKLQIDGKHISARKYDPHNWIVEHLENPIESIYYML